MAGYIYRGTKTINPEPAPLRVVVAPPKPLKVKAPKQLKPRGPRRRPHPSTLKPCGTKAAYDRHRYNQEVPCDPCAEANRAFYRSKHKKKQRKHIPCGTTSGEALHRRRKEKPCDPCKQARSIYGAELYARKKANQ